MYKIIIIIITIYFENVTFFHAKLKLGMEPLPQGRQQPSETLLYRKQLTSY